MADHNKYYLYRKIRKRTDGTQWEVVYPLEYSVDGNGTKTKVVAEYDSEDCGAPHTATSSYTWVQSGTTCDNGMKYNKYIELVSIDSGTPTPTRKLYLQWLTH